LKLYSKSKQIKSQQSFRHENFTFEVSIGFFVIVFTLWIPTIPSLNLSIYINSLPTQHRIWVIKNKNRKVRMSKQPTFFTLVLLLSFNLIIHASRPNPSLNTLSSLHVVRVISSHFNFFSGCVWFYKIGSCELLCLINSVVCFICSLFIFLVLRIGMFEMKAEVDGEFCEEETEECLMRRTLAAHVDYIYTQKHKPKPWWLHTTFRTKYQYKK